MIVINAKIYTMEEDSPIENGYICFHHKIEKIGTMNEFRNSGNDEVIDASGKVVFPGFIDAHTHLGMFEDSLGFEGDDGNEESDPITPHLRAIDAINPNDRYFKEAKYAGVTTVASGPGSANPISGQFCALKTHGTVIDDMVLKAPVAMKFSFGENPKTVYHGNNQQPTTRMATAALIRETLKKAQEYQENLKAAEDNPDDYDKPDYDSKLESLLPVISGELPVKAHAHRADDIATAIRIAKEFNLNMTIEHATEGHLIADKLKEEKLFCMLGPTLSDRSKPELKNLTFDTYRILSKQGTPVSIITDHPEIPINFLPLCAALAVKHGMSETDALKAITITPAKALRIEDRVGSLKVGKDADLVIFDRFPLDIMAKAEAVFINGIKV
ncbi:MAG: amidohydrolase [Clostridia bacterium]|nr:amidohydrolase [Clostridia bacterium]